MPSSRTVLRFQDILDSIADIEQFTMNMSKAAFQADRKTRLAVERAISIISEAAIKLGDDAIKFAPTIEWADIRGIGNIIRHAYDAINPDILWDIVENDLPKLRKSCETAIIALTKK